MTESSSETEVKYVSAVRTFFMSTYKDQPADKLLDDIGINETLGAPAITYGQIAPALALRELRSGAESLAPPLLRRDWHFWPCATSGSARGRKRPDCC